MGKTRQRREPKRPRTELTERFRANLAAAMAVDAEAGSQNALHRAVRQRGVVVSQSTISRVLSGAQSPTLDVVHRLALTLGFEPWQMLVPGFEPKNPPLTKQEDEKLKALYKRFEVARQELAEYFVSRQK